jgi:hypothetical protein
MKKCKEWAACMKKFSSIFLQILVVYTQNKRTRVFGFFKKMQIEFFFFFFWNLWSPIQKASFLMVQSAKFQYSRLNISVIIESNLKIWTQYFIIIGYLKSRQWNSIIDFSCKHYCPITEIHHCPIFRIMVFCKFFMKKCYQMSN